LRYYGKVVLIFFFMNISVASDDVSMHRYQGVFVNYPGTEYEATFIPCGTEELWRISRNAIYAKILSMYNSTETNEYGELYLVVDALITPTNRDLYPNSHFSASLEIKEFITHSNDPDAIKNCQDMDG